MRIGARSTAIALLTLVTAVLLAISTSMTSVMLAATALIMGGTGHPLSVPPDTQTFITDYVNGANNDYIAPSGLCTGGNPGCELVAVYTPEQFRFDTGFADMTFDQSVAEGRANLDNCIRHVSCTVTTAPYSTTGDQTLTDTSFVVTTASALSPGIQRTGPSEPRFPVHMGWAARLSTRGAEPRLAGRPPLPS